MSGYNTKLIKHLEDQGATVKRTKKGILIMGPNGGTVTMHNTPSDYRTLANEKATLRRIGLTHLDEKKTRGPAVKNEEGYAAYITEAVVSKNTRKAILAELEKQAWPLEVTIAELESVGHFSTVAKALYAVGYRYHPDGKKRGHNTVWVAPDDIINLHDIRQAWEKAAKETPGDSPLILERVAVPEPEPVPEPEVNDVGDPVEPEPEDEDDKDPDVREFIDTVNSWTVDIGRAPAGVRDYLYGLRAAGLEVEIRVWRE